MLRINAEQVAPGTGPDSARTPHSSSARAAGREVTATPPDEISLSSATTSIISARSARVAELGKVVNEPGYDPPALPISKKLIEGALARSADPVSE